MDRGEGEMKRPGASTAAKAATPALGPRRVEARESQRRSGSQPGELTFERCKCIPRLSHRTPLPTHPHLHTHTCTPTPAHLTPAKRCCHHRHFPYR